MMTWPMNWAINSPISTIRGSPGRRSWKRSNTSTDATISAPDHLPHPAPGVVRHNERVRLFHEAREYSSCGPGDGSSPEPKRRRRGVSDFGCRMREAGRGRGTASEAHHQRDDFWKVPGGQRGRHWRLRAGTLTSCSLMVPGKPATTPCGWPANTRLSPSVSTS